MGRRAPVPLVALLLVLLLPGRAVAQPSDPSQWPAAPGADPELTATPQTLRFSGPDRYQTNLAVDLSLRGRGGFPFDTSDRTSANAPSLAAAGDWWGPGTCPRSVVVVAGDTFADALAAASLSDSLDRSSEPRVERVAAADPAFDAVGGTDRVDTAFAPIVVTASARSGARALSPSARVTMTDLAKGGCTTAREAIIVGGRSAIDPAVEQELVGLGYDEVFRIAGVDRYDTAARVARALGTGPPLPAGATCLDEDASDGRTVMGWYGNGTIEYRPDATHCILRDRTVAIAEGGTGADALAAGWWTSYWQVPVLLTEPDGTLPAATRAALRDLDIGTVVVLGGTARIPESPTVDQVRALTSVRSGTPAAIGRFAGADRYATSAQLARAFGGWWATGDGRDFAGDRACFVASSGVGAGSSGWADALAAGPWCGRLSASGTAAPRRSTPGADDGGQVLVGGRAPAHDAVPVLLVPAGGALPSSVRDLLAADFAGTTPWCGTSSVASCVDPGFGIVFGGTGVIPDDTVQTAGAALAGGRELGVGDQRPSVATLFATRLDLSPLFRPVDGTTGPRACAPAGALANVRWLSRTADTLRRSFLGEVDVEAAAPGPDGISALCTGLGAGLDSVTVSGVSRSGHVAAGTTFDLRPDRYVALTDPIRQDAVRDVVDGTEHWRSVGPPSSATSLRRGASASAVDGATLDLQLSVGPGGTTQVQGSLEVDAGQTVAAGEVVASAQRTSEGWSVRGTLRVADVLGGFRADLVDGSATATWSFDLLGA